MNNMLADVDISPNPNTLKKLESEYIFFKIEGIHESNYFQTQKSAITIQNYFKKLILKLYFSDLKALKVDQLIY